MGSGGQEAGRAPDTHVLLIVADVLFFSLLLLILPYLSAMTQAEKHSDI